MARFPKCKVCGKDVLDKEQAIKKYNGYYHQECWDKFQTKKESEQSDKQILLDYINKLYDNHIPKYVYIQIEEFKKNYNMTYMGMLLTLKNCFETLEIQFDNEKGIGIIPFYYDKTSRDWLHEQEISKAVEEFEFEDKEIVVNKRFDNSKLKKLKYQPIKMEEL